MIREAIAAIARRLGRRPAHAPHDTGRRAEHAAARYLAAHGYRVLARNARTPTGEIDIVCLERASGQTVLVEVKSAAGHATPASAVERHLTAAQRRRLLRSAALVRRRDPTAGAVRIDVVTVRLGGDGPPDIRHHRAAVRA